MSRSLLKKEGAALLVLRLYVRGADSTKGKQRHEGTYHIDGDSHDCDQGGDAGEHAGELRAVLPGDGLEALDEMTDDGKDQALPGWEGALSEDWLGK
jgi:hypothetical protein